jgi:hypothetical protein
MAASPERLNRCGVCLGDPKVLDAIAVFAEARKSKRTALPWLRFFRECLVGALGFKLGRYTLMRHVNECLGTKP